MRKVVSKVLLGSHDNYYFTEFEKAVELENPNLIKNTIAGLINFFSKHRSIYEKTNEETFTISPSADLDYFYFFYKGENGIEVVAANKKTNRIFNSGILNGKLEYRLTSNDKTTAKVEAFYRKRCFTKSKSPFCVRHFQSGIGMVKLHKAVLNIRSNINLKGYVPDLDVTDKSLIREFAKRAIVDCGHVFPYAHVNALYHINFMHKEKQILVKFFENFENEKPYDLGIRFSGNNFRVFKY